MDNIVKKAMLATMYLIVICLLTWALFPAWRTLAAGLILGTAASAVNALLLRRRIDLLGRQAISDASKRVGTGMLSRLATILLAVMTAYRFPDAFHLVGVLAACFYVQIVVFVLVILQNNRHTSGKE